VSAFAGNQLTTPKLVGDRIKVSEFNTDNISNHMKTLWFTVQSMVRELEARWGNPETFDHFYPPVRNKPKLFVDTNSVDMSHFETHVSE
jgi:hypothetical protein